MLFGAHCSGGVKKALDKAVEMNADVVQLFVQSPRTWRFPNHKSEDLESFRDRHDELGVPALVHSLYLVNLAAPDAAPAPAVGRPGFVRPRAVLANASRARWRPTRARHDNIGAGLMGE